MGKISSATQWMINLANDNTHGYDQTNRWGPNYDCSSAIITAWEQAGVPVKSNGATYTGNMRSVFLKCGFTDVTSSVVLSSGSGMQYGDVLLNTTDHTAMHIGNGQVVHASINEKGTVTGGVTGDQTGKEICVTSYFNYPWNFVLRYTGNDSGGGTTTSEYEVRRYVEYGTCYPRVTINFRSTPNAQYSSNIIGQYYVGESVKYDIVVETNKYVYISWIGASSGTRRYMAVFDLITRERFGDCV